MARRKVVKSKKKVMNPIEVRLRMLVELQKGRNTAYAETYKMKGDVMMAMFKGKMPVLDNELDINRYAMLDFIVSKLIRYTQNWEEGHADSLDDVSVYCTMLNVLDKDLT